MLYAREHLPNIKTARNSSYMLAPLSEWWTGNIDQITASRCRAYAAERGTTTARNELETLRAAINFWHRERGPLPSVPAIVLPPKPEPRERYLTREEAAKLLWAARHKPHLTRFILLGLYTGSRSAVVLGMQWSQIDMKAGVMRRRGAGVAEDARKRTPPVRLGRRILSHLRRWQRIDAALGVTYLCHYDGRKIDKLRTAWPAAVKRAGLGAEVTPHILRHTRATWLMQNGVDPWEAAGHLGMTIGTLTRVYGKHSPDYQKRAAEV